ncbi:hypothetical protein [Caedibacter taeniospiralis]|jgi:argininosuccinate synthase|uniref:hypothetical protein n=1 Tax=Caedibacter taeniospiralis TaxID=28907 RepID=UPI0037BF9161
MKLSNIEIVIANSTHCHFAETISRQIEESAKQRKTDIAKRSVSYLQDKLRTQHAVIAIDQLLNTVAGFCYIESWQDKRYVSNSGLFVFPPYRNLGLSKVIKKQGIRTCENLLPRG